MKSVLRFRRALRKLAVAAALSISKAASAAWFLFSALAFGAKATAGAAAAALGASVLAGVLVIGGAYVGYQLLQPDDPAHRAIEILRPGPDGRPTSSTIGVADGKESDPALAEALGVDSTVSSQPAPWEAGAPAPKASAPGTGTPVGSHAAAAPPASTYEQALALTTMVHWDDGLGQREGWPTVSYCRAGVAELSCRRDDLWLRNDAAVAIEALRICVATTAQKDYRLDGAGADGCVEARVEAHGDFHIDVVQTSSGSDYPKYKVLVIELSVPHWRKGTVLRRLYLPVVRPLSFFDLDQATADDERHAVVVQERRVSLLAKMVVFTYHGSGESYLRVDARDLNDPTGGLRIVGAARDPRAYKRLGLSECLPGAASLPLTTSTLPSGGSCGVLVATSDVHRDPYAGATAGNPGSPGPSFGMSIAEHAKSVEGRLRMGFTDVGRRSSQRLSKVVPTLVRPVFVAGGDFSLAGPVGTMAMPVPGLVWLRDGTLEPPIGLMLTALSRVQAIATSPDGGSLYIGGILSQPGPLPGAPGPASRLANTDGPDWHLWSSLVGPNAAVLALAPSTQGLFVGGRFVAVAGQTVPGIVLLRNADDAATAAMHPEWVRLGNGVVAADNHGQPLPATVRALLPEPGGDVIAGGDFEVCRQPAGNSIACPYVARWNSQAQLWQDLGGGPLPNEEPELPSRVDALSGDADGLMVGGRFDAVADAPAGAPVTTFGWARFAQAPAAQGNAWRAVMSEQDLWGHVRSFAMFQGALYAGGEFQEIDHQHALLRLQNGQLTGFGQDLWIRGSNTVAGDLEFASSVRAMASVGDMLCLGGRFLALSDGSPAPFLACRGADTQVHPYAGQGVDRPVDSLLGLWEMQVENEV